ncbi:MAG TPA: DNA mismatch repair protein MutS [Candidatus Borkfalkia faecigallinarum]|uniref:DNA mismatch repair protein MutS n=1 Tax=Candidatus Borkfalkia faecigallinarum TaxID=2838509 RepID=A0A9D1VUQ7_9FIRM|nr:DNA mismatch repair protein MutS [Candidatus Borkfalkia faecigallinarum]
MSGLSPMMRHYLEVKEKYKDCIVFYRLGDFYEMFFEDAKEVSQLLDLTLTGRDCGLEERAPMCGVPFHAADAYIARLVGMGKKVAICEQLTEPTPGKGMVERDVIRVVSAGTLIEDNLIDEKKNNYIACAFRDGALCALAWADITTGEFCARIFAGDALLRDSLEELVKLAPAEIICNDGYLLGTKGEPALRALPAFSCYAPWAFSPRRAEKALMEQLGCKTLEPFGLAGLPAAVCAAGALVEYLRETQKHSLRNIDGIRLVSSGEMMMLDPAAISDLELVRTLGDGKRRGSLLWLLDKTQTSMGARRMHKLVLNPLRRKEDICTRLDGVEELYNATVIRGGIADTLKGIRDIERIAGKISNNNLTPRDCESLASSLALVPNLKFQLSGFHSRVIGEIDAALGDFSALTQLLQGAFIENPPVSVKEGGFIRKGYDRDLDELRDIRDNGARMIAEIETREREKTGIKNLRIKYNRVFGYSIEVTNSFKDKVPYEYRRRQTLANAERYVTDELKQAEDRILSSSEKSLRLEIELFEKIKEVLASQLGALKRLAGATAMLDCLTAFASLAKESGYCRPQIAEEGAALRITDGRHPVVEALSRERFVPNDTALDAETRTMVITGPNMAGKSTYMRQTALIALMAHVGCFVPAKSAQIPVIDRIFTRVGASDNLILDQSTFMVEMTEVASIIRGATQNSLLILDEVGRGTSTFDGLSIAWAVLEYLTEHIRAKTLFATHYHELTELEGKIDGVKNYKVTVRETGDGILFLRKIVRGGANKSFGIEVARLAGIPPAVTSRAKEILRKLEKNDIARDAARAVASDEAAARQSEAERILSEIDMNNLTPMQAFGVLSDLVEKVRTKG